MGKPDLSHWTDEEREKYLADQKAGNVERRRQSRTPQGIQSTNRKKRNGNMSFTLTPDGTCFILQMTTNVPAARLLLEMIQKLDPGVVKRFDVDTKGKQQIELTVRKPKQVLELAGVKPVPEKCQRCDGYGGIGLNGKPDGGNLLIGGTTRCPACNGSGRALPEESEGE